ncbi:hypothetical protein ABPG77_007485 [Micractinium sp. CCAP 211/92]
MRNLHTCLDFRQELPLPCELGDVVRFAVDSDAGVLYVAGSGLGVAAYRTSDCELLWFVDLRERAAAAEPSLEAAAVAAFDHCPELEALCLALSTGELLLLRGPEGVAGSGTSSGSSPEVEEVGAVEGGLAAAAWSPDGELLALVTCTAQLLLMNKDWELLSEVPLLQQGGTGGAALPARPAADATADHPQAALSPDSVSITWRGDGLFFATTSLDSPDAASAVVRIWDRQTGELHASGEAAVGLLPTAAWQPNGRHLYVASSMAGPAAVDGEAEVRAPAVQGGAPPPKLPQSDDSEQAQMAAAEGIAHVGAWKRELRRRQAERAAAGSGNGVAADRPAAGAVLLYERNGLRHGGFELPAAEGSCIEQLAWSPDSEFLAVVLREDWEHNLPQQVLQLWHRSNWHWYLKAERRYGCCPALRCAWDAQAPLLLHLATADGLYQQLQFSRQPTVSRRGTAVVVDGSTLLLTPLRHTVVPPPMCAAAAALPAPVSCLAVRDFGEDEAIAAVLSDGSLALLSCVEEDLWEETLEEQLEGQPWQGLGTPKLLPQRLALDSPALEAAAATGSGGIQTAAWVSERRLLVVASISSSASALLVELEVDVAASRATEVAAVDRDVPRLLCCASRPAGGALLQQHGGGLLLYSPGGQLARLPPSAGFPTACPHMVAMPAEAAANGPAAAAALGLSPRGQLFWGTRQLASDVTSFALRHSGTGGAYLLFTTRQHQLHTASLASLADGSSPLLAAGGQAGGAGAAAAGGQHGMQAAGQQGFRAAMKAAMRPAGGAAGAAVDVTVRSIEQHAMLVAVPPGNVEAILQMPRGNLEAVRPRALVLPAVAAALDAGEFAAAWELATTNRLDLNVLVDYRWPRFLDQAAAFVEQVSGDPDIADLLSALEEGSTTAAGGLYAAALLPSPADNRAQQPQQPEAQQTGEGLAAELLPAAGSQGGEQGPAGSKQTGGESGKVRAVCSAVRRALQSRDPARYLRAILTSHAKSGDLEGALAAVKEAKEEALQVRRAAGVPSAEDGLKHLALTTLDDTLYAGALGMYELELAYMVVAHSQKDPGEYLLELQRFAAIPDIHLRRHAIDIHLRRWERALQHLVAAGEAHFGAALGLARDKGLLRLLLKLVEGNKERQRQVNAAYAEALEAKNMPEDAGLTYLAAGKVDDAIRAYRAAGQWRMCFALAARAGWSADQHRRLAAGLADELSAIGRGAEAAAISLEYLKNVDSAVLLLAHAKEWREALRIAYGNGRSDLVDTVVAPQAAQAAAAALEEINDNIERVAKYWARLRQLRQRRDALEAALAAADAESGLPSRQQAEDVLDDAASVADSLISGLSIYTDHTHTGATTVTSSSVASTVGGKRRGKAKSKGKSKTNRIRAGSPQEEEHLSRHVLDLAPSAATCSEVGQLAELLVLLGHQSDAALLQQRLSKLVSEQAAAAADILAHPPPALALALPQQQVAALQAAAGPAGAAAAAALLAALPGVELQQRVAAAAAAVRESHWKWDVLREAPAVPPLPAGIGGSQGSGNGAAQAGGA